GSVIEATLLRGLVQLGMLIPVSFATSCFPVRRLRPPRAPGLIGRRQPTQCREGGEAARSRQSRASSRRGSQRSNSWGVAPLAVQKSAFSSICKAGPPAAFRGSRGDETAFEPGERY